MNDNSKKVGLQNGQAEKYIEMILMQNGITLAFTDEVSVGRRWQWFYFLLKYKYVQRLLKNNS